MKTFLAAVLLVVSLAVPLSGKTHKDQFNAPCGDVWVAVKATVSDTNHYNLLVTDEGRMALSYTIKGAVRDRNNSVVLVPNGGGCEMQTTSEYSGLIHSDAGDFKSRVEEQLAKVKSDAPTKTPAAK
jgi:hypothetical protein